MVLYVTDANGKYARVKQRMIFTPRHAARLCHPAIEPGTGINIFSLWLQAFTQIIFRSYHV